MSRILIVDDEPSICWTLTEALKDEGHTCRQASSAEEGLELAREFEPQVIMLDVRLPGRSGLEVLAELKASCAQAPVIVMTAFGDLQTAVKAVSSGAFEYLVKPFELDDALRLVKRATTENSASTANGSQATTAPVAPTGMIGRSAKMQQVFKQIALAAACDVPVLITGESGTGKELVAEAIHQHSRRGQRPFLPVVVAALNENVIESELFGHTRGAFTGAERERAGVLEMASGGTVMLDEVGDIPLGTQVKLLRAIERQEWLPVGDSRTRRGDFRVIAATHRPLAKMIHDGTFREDLFYRLNVFSIELPPLRDRLEDLAELAQAFLSRMGQGNENRSFSASALEVMKQRLWPGNVRELKNVVEHAAVVSRASVIGPESLPAPIAPAAPVASATEPSLSEAARQWARTHLRRTSDDAEGSLYDQLLAEVEPALLEEAMKYCKDNRVAAAQRLGIHRATLRQKLRRYGLDDRVTDD